MSNIPLPQLTLNGLAIDNTELRCNIYFNSNNFQISKAPNGRLLNLNYLSEITVSSIHYQGQPKSIYIGEAKGILLTIQGYLSTIDNSWSTNIPTSNVQRSGNWENVGISLDDADIEAIENARNGQDLILNISLSGLAKIVAPTAIVIQSQEGQEQLTFYPSEIVRIDGGSSLQVTITREKWLKMLEQVGATRFLVELPTPKLPQAQKEWEQVIRLLNEATHKHRSGDNEGVLEKCREIIEGITSVMSRQWNIQRQPGKPGFENLTHELQGRLENAWPKDKEQAKAITNLLYASWVWASPSHHYGFGIPLREEAAFALHLTTNLLSFGAQILQAHPKPLDANDM